MTLQTWLKQSDVVLGIGAMVILGMLIVPLPGFLLDILLIFSIGIGFLILLTALSVREPLDFSIFPSILLVTTLFRLALNVSTTRQILSKGPSMGSSVIDAFGTFVVGSESGMGKYVVGFIIFLILIIVQIMVITKGATRISEVAARFTLDALPGKQMSIDMELNNGRISDDEARKKQKKIQKEVDFYGTMDGASKFVQGDVRAGLIITAINLIGGIIIGSSIRGESFVSAIETYGKFTIGDGLVSQIPGLLSTTATGIIVTRAGSESDFSKDISGQLFTNSKVMYLVAGFLGLASLIPGLPFLSMNLMAGGLAYLAYTTDRVAKEEVERAEGKDGSKAEERKPENYYKELRNDPIEVEIGLNLVPLVQQDQGGILLEAIGSTRKRFAIDTGIVIPAVRIIDNLDLHMDAYAIKINGVVVGESKIRADKLMAVNNNPNQENPIDGEKFTEPTFGMQAIWIDPSLKAEAENRGYTVVDPSTVIVTHLKEIISSYASTLLGRDEVKALLDHVKQTHPTLVAELEVDRAGSGRLGLIQQVLQNLLRESVVIRSLPAILEAVATQLPRTQDPDFISEHVRQAIARQIITPYLDSQSVLNVVTIDPKLTDRLSKAVVDDPIEGKIVIVSPDVRNRFLESISTEFSKAREEQRFFVIVTSRYLRQPLAHFLAKDLGPRNFAVLAIEEVQNFSKTRIVGTLNIGASGDVPLREI